jgi:hypothetical protein
MALIKGKQLENDTVTASKVDTTNGGIAEINAGDAAVEGSGTGLSRRDHQHAVDHTGTASTVEIGDSAAEGSAAGLARSDHTHAVTSPGAPADVTKAAAAAGSSANVAREDHKHDVTTATPSDVGTTNAEGSATSLARSDHVHDHGDHAIGDGNQHAIATPSLAGFLSAADKTKLDSAQDLDEIDAKESCRARTQGDHALTGLAAIDTSVTPVDGDRILVDQQSTPAEDGIYIADTSAWSRSADAPTGAEARGWRVWIEDGTVDGDRLYACSNNKGSDVVGTDGLTFGLIGAGSPRGAGAGTVLNGNDIDVASANAAITVEADTITFVALQNDTMHGARGGTSSNHPDAISSGDSGFMTGADKAILDGLSGGNNTPQQEPVTTETITGSDTAIADVLDNIPIVTLSLNLFLNGVRQKQGATFDYTVNDSTGAITWLASSGTAVDMETTDTLDASYLS